MKVLVYSVSNVDGQRKDGTKAVGISLKGIAKNPEINNKPDYFKEWIDETHPDYSRLKQKALSLSPGMVVELDYAVAGRTAILSDINSTGELTVDFDKII